MFSYLVEISFSLVSSPTINDKDYRFTFTSKIKAKVESR